MYKGQRFTITSEEIVFADIDYAAHHFPHARRLFLCDGDALILPQPRLLAILKQIKFSLPQITRVGIYANSKSLQSKTVAELQDLRRLGLGIVYMGLESGDDLTLANINKGATSTQMIEMAAKAKAAGIRLSVTVLLGIAGVERSETHAVETGRVLGVLDPDYVGALSLMLEPGTVLHVEHQAGRFALPEPLAILRELRYMIAATNLSNGLFHANHASNYLPIRAKLPEEKSATLSLIDQALAGKVSLKPEYLRAL
jgi:radical SAM superfamily enzyme YgiQ (UPF0313 family)